MICTKGVVLYEDKDLSGLRYIYYPKPSILTISRENDRIVYRKQEYKYYMHPKYNSINIFRFSFVFFTERIRRK